MKIEKLKTVIDKIVETVSEKNLEGEIELFPDGTFHVYVRPWRPYEMKCPYDKHSEEKNDGFQGISKPGQANAER